MFWDSKRDHDGRGMGFQPMFFRGKDAPANTKSHRNGCILSFSTSFTLIEVVVAIAIFSLGIVAALNMAASAGRRMDRAITRWEKQHMLAQAAEYFLLEGADAQVPDNVFPYEDYSVSCEVKEPVGLPEEVEPQLGEWRLVKYKIILKNHKGEEVESIEFEKIINEHAY